MIQHLNSLRRHVDLTSEALEALLEDYGTYVDTDQASFLKEYLHSLRLDFEMAMVRGEATTLQIIIEDVSDLFDNARMRLDQKRGVR